MQQSQHFAANEGRTATCASCHCPLYEYAFGWSHLSKAEGMPHDPQPINIKAA